MSDFTLFLGKFLKHGTKIASVAPSSRRLAQATIRGIDWSANPTIIELGAGTGPITRAIAEKITTGGRLIAIERDADFAALLRDRFANSSNVEIVEADCGDLSAILADRGIRRVDHVVSGLPVPSFPSVLRVELFRAVGEVLEPNGSYRQITELAWVYQRMYRRYFDDVRFVFEPLNFPPSGAYHCRGLRVARQSVTGSSAMVQQMQ
jgi:phosphatidylethanolamine/phosphatidyl-N-methylethanolamine N-methyltransferase